MNFDMFFIEGESERIVLSEFITSNTCLLIVNETLAKIGALEYIQNELKGVANLAK